MIRIEISGAAFDAAGLEEEVLRILEEQIKGIRCPSHDRPAKVKRVDSSGKYELELCCEELGRAIEQFGVAEDDSHKTEFGRE